MREILSDLVAEQQALDQFLQRINERQWVLPTSAPGWSIKDVVSHLAYTERFAAQVLAEGNSVVKKAKVTDIDAWTALGITEGRDMRYQQVIEWWRNSRADVVDALSRMEGNERVAWIDGDMSARAFATLRLMETWAHGLDIKDAMEGLLVYDEEEEDPTLDTSRIRHVAWLAHRMLPYAFGEAGEDFPDSGIRLELMGPRYARWVYGPEDAPDIIKGIASEWCRIAVQRMDHGATSLKTEGEKADTAIKVVRTY
ncbi:MAG: maleylpyruvate isomerase family mycothiol-dependent enzyme [bacterium]|nr:maleylpyruvate isomerase family mycothiol-dependent enzyme [bacterium]